MFPDIGPTHPLRRMHIYDDMIDLFDNPDIVMQHPFRVCFEGEMGVDTGGLTREAFSAFWEKAYFKHFDGCPLLKPVM